MAESNADHLLDCNAILANADWRRVMDGLIQHLAWSNPPGAVNSWRFARADGRVLTSSFVLRLEGVSRLLLDCVMLPDERDVQEFVSSWPMRNASKDEPFLAERFNELELSAWTALVARMTWASAPVPVGQTPDVVDIKPLRWHAVLKPGWQNNFKGVTIITGTRKAPFLKLEYAAVLSNACNLKGYRIEDALVLTAGTEGEAAAAGFGRVTRSKKLQFGLIRPPPASSPLPVLSTAPSQHLAAVVVAAGGDGAEDATDDHKVEEELPPLPPLPPPQEDSSPTACSVEVPQPQFEDAAHHHPPPPPPQTATNPGTDSAESDPELWWLS
jgi:hypothetical protein